MLLGTKFASDPPGLKYVHVLQQFVWLRFGCACSSEMSRNVLEIAHVCVCVYTCFSAKHRTKVTQIDTVNAEIFVGD